MRYLFTVLFVAVTLSTAHAKAMEEVNAQRANFGLPPLVEDAALSQWAQQRAEYFARHHISIYNGYNGHEGTSPGPGYVEGGGALPKSSPQDAWCSCAMRTVGNFQAGAGVAWGSDGVRYMCLVIRAPSTRDGGLRRPLVATSHLTPEAPRIPYGGPVPKGIISGRRPGVWYRK